jgi:hypothetical protein
MDPNAANELLDIVRKGYENDASGGNLDYKNNFYLERGPYDIVSVMEESIDDQPFVAEGPVIDLFDPQLPVICRKSVNPGEQAFLFDLKRIKNKLFPAVLASASRIYDEKRTEKSYSFLSKGAIKTVNTMRILLPRAPKNISVTNSFGNAVTILGNSWDPISATTFLSFDNQPQGIMVHINW